MYMKRIILEEMGSDDKVVREPLYILYSTYNSTYPFMLYGRPDLGDDRRGPDWRFYRTSSYDRDGNVLEVGQASQPATIYDTEQSLKQNDDRNLKTLESLFIKINLKELNPKKLPTRYKSMEEAEKALGELNKWVSEKLDQKDLGESGEELNRIASSIKIIPMALETRLTIMNTDEGFFDNL